MQMSPNQLTVPSPKIYLGIVIILLTTLFACATLRSPDDPAPTSHPTDTLPPPTATLTLIPTVTSSPIQTPTPTPTITASPSPTETRIPTFTHIPSPTPLPYIFPLGG